MAQAEAVEKDAAAVKAFDSKVYRLNTA